MISVVIPAYNAQNHIARAIDSVLAQTLPANEIIVVDDGSTDNTANIVKSYGDNITYIHQSNSGSGATRNTGINAAASEWIAFLDCDDQWLPDKIKLQYQLLQNNPDLVWAYSNFYRYSETNYKQMVARDTGKASQLLDDKEYFQNYLNAQSNGLSAWTSTVIAKKQVLIDTGLFNTDLPLAQDIDLWFRIAYKYPSVGYINHPLAIYNLDTPQSNVKKFTDISYICKVIDIHIDLSAKHNLSEEFKPCLLAVVHNWVLRLSRQKRYKDMNKLITRYKKYLPARYYLRKKIRALFPAPVECYNKITAKLRN